MQQKLKRSFIREILEHTNSTTISFAGGLPDKQIFPLDKLQTAINKTLSKREIWQYGRSAGYQPLRELIANRYSKDGFKTKADEILITTGSQQALDIISRYYQNSKITIEKPCYLGAYNVFNLNKMFIDPIRLEFDGIDIDQFKNSIKESHLSYLIPNFQNPSSISYSQKKIEKIATLIQESNSILIEDAPYSDLYFYKKPPQISKLIPKHSLHIGSLSKTISPSLRIGWIRADKRYIDKLLPYKESMDLHTSTLTQAIAYEFLEDETSYQKHLQYLRESYHKKMNFFAKELQNYLPDFEFQKPKGGMFIYGKIEGVNSLELLKRSLQNGVVFVPGSHFLGADDEIRFNFTNSSYHEIQKGLHRIQEVL